MKHQYFGDVRDLFMFDLVLEILRGTDLERFTYIPMLTRDTDSEYVLKTDMERAVAGRDNTLLRDYLETCYRDGKRSIYETEGIFHLPGFNRYRYAIHRTRFQDEVRMQYFLEVPKDVWGVGGCPPRTGGCEESGSTGMSTSSLLEDRYKDK